MTDRQHILDEASKARAQAQDLLNALSQSQASVTAGGRPDVFLQVAGASSIEQAIATTRRLIDTYDRILGASSTGGESLSVCVPARTAAGPWTVAALYESRIA